MGALAKGLAGLTAVIIFGQAITSCDEKNKQQEKVVSERDSTRKVVDDCTRRHDELLDAAKKLQANREFSAASEVIIECAMKTSDPELTALNKTLQVDLARAQLDKIPKAQWSDRLLSIRALKNIDDKWTDFESELKQLESKESVELKNRKARREAEEKKVAAQLKAQKRKEGVRIGMSKQDVLDSSWGRPDRVNRTTNAYGTHEQWVYHGNYLYFDNDVLTTIQN